MEFLNVGPLELLAILLIMFILLGPNDMVQTARKIGQWTRRMVRSPIWRDITGYSQEIRDLPRKIMDESGLEESITDIRQTTQSVSADLREQLKQVNEGVRIPTGTELVSSETNAEENHHADPPVAYEPGFRPDKPVMLDSSGEEETQRINGNGSSADSFSSPASADPHPEQDPPQDPDAA
jgi:Sec-independent protein translocase protein TatA